MCFEAFFDVGFYQFLTPFEHKLVGTSEAVFDQS
jgi:hypothetical protein